MGLGSQPWLVEVCGEGRALSLSEVCGEGGNLYPTLVPIQCSVSRSAKMLHGWAWWCEWQPFCKQSQNVSQKDPPQVIA